MRKVLIALGVVILVAPQFLEGQANDRDLLGVLIAEPGMAERLGVAKLSPEELVAWNQVLNIVFTAANGQSGTAPPGARPSGLPRPASGNLFEAKVDEANDNLVQLSNGAIVEVTGFLGFVGFRKDAALIRQGDSWRLWIDGKRTMPATVLRQPQGRPRSAEFVSIGEVRGNGSIISLMDGRLLEVDAIDRIYTGLWLGYSEGVLIDGIELLNLNDGERVHISRIR